MLCTIIAAKFSCCNMKTRTAKKNEVKEKLFKKACRCKDHCSNDSKLIDLSFRKVPGDVVARMLDQKKITKKKVSVCVQCLEYYGGLNQSENDFTQEYEAYDVTEHDGEENFDESVMSVDNELESLSEPETRNPKPKTPLATRST